MQCTDTITACVQLIAGSRKLVDSQIIASYTEDLDSFVPAAWLDCLEAWPYEKLIHLPDHISSVTEPSLLAFLTQALSLYPNYPTFTEELQPSGLESRGMIPKKMHEVRRLSAFISQLCSRLSVHSVVDLGAGLCYLSHFLSTKCGLRVKGVEAKAHNSQAAQVRGDFIAKKLMREEPQFEVVEQIVTADNFADVCSERCLLVGLHTCGDLAATSLKMLAAVEGVAGVVNVGCCYNLLSESVQAEAAAAVAQYTAALGASEKGDSLDHTFVQGEAGYPMSHFLRSHFPAFYLGRMARLLALNDFSESMLQNPAENLKKYSYRAAFQWVLRHCGIAKPVTVGRRIKHFGSFGEYVLKVCARKQVEISLSAEELDGIYEREFRRKEKRAAALWVLRAVLGPVVENLIVSDRVAYLSEQGMHAEVWEVFDRRESPRCLAIVGLKPGLLG